MRRRFCDCFAGIPTVAVFSKPDASACHVAMADESVCIGPASAKDSYLRQDRILEAAVSTGATAIHPGYGFLSENATFASECRNNNLIFVGPSAAAILAMGDKAQAKTLMASAKVPIVPGYHGDDQNDELLKGEADRIGYPLLVKAIMGGGGKGMKLAKNNNAFMEALHSARREAMASFGDDRVILEKFIEVPRHIEVQVIADTFGNYYFLAERDCSVQRRHQKIIEEAPAPQISENFRRKLGFSALEAAKAVQYCNAGTIEFIVDSLSGTHYFMEMNTRLQVEHPVTEAVTGVDLVELQLRVASGQSLKDLGFLQSNMEPVGHAVEARLYAENPLNDFLPSGGELLRWRMPVEASAFGFGTEHDKSLRNTDGIQSIDSREIVRVDSGVKQGDEVGVYYDPMIAKVIAKASDRNKALTALSDALGSLQIAGFPTNVAFVQRLLNHREFRKGPVDTGFISRHEEELLAPVSLSNSTAVIAAIAMLMRQVMNDGNMYEKPFFVGNEGDPNNITEYTQVISNPWSISDSFRLNHSHTIEIPTIKHIGSDIPIDAVVQMKGQNNCIVSFRNLGGELPRHCSIVKYNGRHIQAIVDDHLLSSDLEFHQYVIFNCHWIILMIRSEMIVELSNPM